MYDPAQSLRPRKRVLTPRIQEDQPVTETQEPKRETAIVIYRPDFGEPPEIMMFATETKPGISFKANEPVEVPYSFTVEQLLVEKFQTPDGTRSRAIERKVPAPDVLQHVDEDGKIVGNPSFEVNGFQPPRSKAMVRLPTDSDAYRGYCINWISVSMSADSMDKRWVGEEGLRQRCGCSPSDIGYLRPFFDARRMECAELDRQRRVA